MIVTEEMAGITGDLTRQTAMLDAVHRGVTWLNRHAPGWKGKIQLEALDLGDCGNCVLGQVYGYYRTNKGLGDLEYRIKLGFTWYDDAHWPELTATWREVLGQLGCL